MKLAIMQPYFFPYLGYFSLVKHTDQFILLDSVQFIRHGWIERNRILKQDKGWVYIKVPVIKENGRETLIKEVLIDNQQNWKQKIIAQLQPYRKIAPYYFPVIKMLNELFDLDFKNIVSLNKASLGKVCDYLGLAHNIHVFSEINLNFEQPDAPDEWALNICKAFGTVDEYWNPPGGQSFFNREKFERISIDLKFQRINLLPYKQNRYYFEPGLSIIDAMMFNPKTDIHKMLDNFELL